MYFPLQDIEAAKLNKDDPEHLRIHSLETFGTHDGPGIRMVVFVQGCQFRCVYCQNPDTLDVTGGTLVTIEELVKRAVRQRNYFGKEGGVTVSGGEPLLQRSKLTDFFLLLHEEGINTCLDTNGRLNNKEVHELLAYTDLLLLDVKHINNEIHHRLTGLTNKNTLGLAEYRESTGKRMWLRYVLVPGWTDQPEHLEEWGQHFANYKTVERVEIIPFHQLGAHKWELLNMNYPLKDTLPPTAESKKQALDIFQKYFKNVILK
ncbi:pyruvate formate-lyase-activating protein [Solitalea canadensis]|uniref:Pyruvate formate-lyase-activating enzyme n=1 Tax=Solitalea canadensis (strain ATCC 29591 / DSM 3403 / JCM 21819 / LMG 8368 / NBRC 15130 / NCIMB 12057 / USAM 9D) TaxID=929556 RepID=H8KRM6_SOLCM|nr:pyruvate formate-lyase-activating protein [Solitalea canadensis]AFD07607.1 pyruvate formate-lyase 1-activating enzyme [Solitalea canadensis DSM 3403]